MSRVSASVTVPGRVAEAEALWYDPVRWPGFVDGFSSVLDRDEGWPREGRLVWTSRPGGRGRVVERVTRYEPRAGQAADVEDEQIRGRQEVAFRALEDGGGTRVTLTLDYEIKDRKPLTSVVDLLFVRRAWRESLRRTLERFAAERRGDHDLVG